MIATKEPWYLVKDKMDTLYHAKLYTLLQKTGNSFVVKSPERVSLEKECWVREKYQEPENSKSVPDFLETFSELVIVAADTCNGDGGQPSLEDLVLIKQSTSVANPVLWRLTRVTTV